MHSLPELINKASALVMDGKQEEARAFYREWIAQNGHHPLLYVAHFNCSAIDTQLGDTAAAIEALKQAIALNADFIPAYINLGGVLDRAGAKTQALELWQTAVSRPLHINGTTVSHIGTALKQMARVLADCQELESAETILQQCLNLHPHHRDVVEQYTATRMSQCKWPIAQDHEAIDRKTLVQSIHPLSMAAYTDDPILQLAAAECYSRQAFKEEGLPFEFDRRNAAIDLNKRRLRVGYISSDLRDHAVGYLMSEFFELHGKNDIEVFAYYCGPASTSALAARIKTAVEHWTDIRDMSDDEAARIIAKDGIDVLVDVNGHTRDSRTGVFMRRPAPVQVNWLGYPGTMGTPYHHYIIADDWIIPPASEIYYSEKVLRLPCYQANDRKRVVADERPTRRDAGLPDDAMVFCCFNSAHKITRFTFERWMQILRGVPGSVLWLLDTSVETKKRLGDHAEANSVARERIVFAPKLHNAYHLARYPLADLFLDTVPYGAHTTSSDALWCGVPVLTLSGRCFASRVCGSLVRSAGLPELVCTTPQDYVARAITLANDRQQLEAYKNKLKESRDHCVTFDMDLLVASIEQLYRNMARDHNEGRTPQPDLTNLGVYLDIGAAFDHEATEMLAVADYEGLYKSQLTRRYLARPFSSDARLWGADEISSASGRQERAYDVSRANVSAPKDTAHVTQRVEGTRTMIDQVLAELKAEGYAPRTLLDVGAHVGTFSHGFLQYFPDCVPTLIEPNPYCADTLNGLGFEWHAVAASNKSGRATLFLTREWLQSTGVSLYRENTQHFRDEVIVRHEVETRRIDDLFSGRRFDFVKIDTQGAELDVLRGGESVLRQANYILVEVSLVDYNAGGARAEAVFAQLREMGFRCADVTEFHRLANVQGGNLLQLDFLFRRRDVRLPAAVPIDTDGLRVLSETMAIAGQRGDAIRVLEWVAQSEPCDARILQSLATLLGAEGRVLEALVWLKRWKHLVSDLEALVAPVQELLPLALAKFNTHLAANEMAEAEKYVSALIALIPMNQALLDTGLSLNLALGRKAKAKEYAGTLIQLVPTHNVARELIAADSVQNAPTEQAPDSHPLIRLRDVHDSISDFLCDPLTEERAQSIKALLAMGQEIRTMLPPGSEMSGWETHYRVMLDGFDIDAVEAATPTTTDDEDVELVSSDGNATTWLKLRQAAARLGAEVVFFAAADRAYVDLYARPYVKSVLKHCDVSCLVVVHVIGGAGQLKEAVQALDLCDKRVFFCGDGFDPHMVLTQCFDAPPKGKAQKPLAHLQSVRFLRLGSLLRKLALPVFVSDIDLLLQQGVADLLLRTAETDLVLNKNELSRYAGSRYTANLLLARPTANALTFADFLAAYLRAQLAKPRVSRWIDQIGLMMAQHHMARHGTAPNIAYFDTSRDINNVMYPSYQDNPFRFLSLYHGFDMSSLDRKDEMKASPRLRGKKPRRSKSKVA
jgi:FkbM family methyltransferase